MVHTIHAKVNTKQHASIQDTAHRFESESESVKVVKGESLDKYV